MFLKLFNKIGGTGLFLLFVGILYSIMFLFNSEIIIKSINESFYTFINWTWILLLIFLLMIILDIFINKKSILNLFNKNNYFFLWIFSIIGGIVSTGPIYMWYPLLSKLKLKGLKDRFIVTFLYNRSIKLPLIIPMIEVFSIKVVLILLPIMIIFSIINGFFVEFLVKFINNKNHNKLK